MRTHVLRNGSLPCPSRVLVIPKAMLCCLIFGLPFLAGQVSDCAIAKSPVGEMRTWKDQTGAFQVEATLLDVHNGRITLRKKDGRLVRPPISLLSDADQEFVSKWEEAREAGNIFAGGVMPKPTEEDGDDDTGPVAASGKRLPSWRPGTEPVEVQSGRILVLQSMGRPALKDPDPAAVVHSKKDAGTLSLTAMKGVTGPVPLILDQRNERLLLRKVAGHWDKEKFTQAVIVDPRQIKAQATTRWEEQLVFDNSHAPTGRVVGHTNAGNWGATSEMILWSVTRTGQFRELLRWLPMPGMERTARPNVTDVHFVNESRVLARVGNTMMVWDLAKRAVVWQLNVHSWHRPAISRGGRYFAAQNRQRIGVFESATGKQLGLIPWEHEGVVSMGFSPDGTQLAVAGERRLAVFHMQDPQLDTTTELTEKIETFHSRPAWTDDDHIMVGGSWLVDHKLGALVWQYDTGGRCNDSKPLTTGLLRGIASSHGELHLFELALPHQAALDAKKGVDFASQIRLRRGDSVRLELDLAGPTDTEKVRQLLTDAIDHAGWKLSDQSDNVVRYTNYRTIERTQKYGSGRFKGQEFPFRPYAASLDITVDGNLVYRVVDNGAAPSEMKIGLNETLGEAIERQTVPSYRMLERLTLPSKIIDPKLQKGLGRTQLTADGWKEDASFDVSLPETPPRGS